MILRILGWLLFLIIILFIGYWIYTGGLTRSINIARSLDNPLGFFTSSSTFGGTITLPGQPDTLFNGIDITQGSDFNGRAAGLNQEAQLNALQQQYDELYAKVKDPRNFGNPSPYRDKVTFGIGNPQDGTPANEFLILQANYSNTAPVSLSGWSLQSAVTGVRIALPPAAPNFISGILNTVQQVALSPGGSAVVVSGTSPVGVSLRENICTGYLGDLQNFTPELNRECPSASDELALNAQNISTYGDACIDYARTVPTCHFPGKDPKPSVSDACANFLLNRLSYNGCAYAHRAETSFYKNTWRLFLASNVNLWRDTHDVIRLLDEESRTVDVLTY